MSRIVPVLGFVGASGSGKTTLLEQVVGLLTDAGVHLAVLKQAGPGFEIDPNPSKDSHRLRAAGADQVLVASSDRWALIGQQADPLAEPSLDEMLRRLDGSALDGVLVEGFGHEAYPKIEVYRPARGRPPLFWPHDPSVIAVASDVPLTAYPARWLDLNDVPLLTSYVAEQLGLSDLSINGLRPIRELKGGGS
jgi:molybdopterin-guanine dinucleotide biosynthesis adapter protein